MKLKTYHRIKLRELQKGNLAILDHLKYNTNASKDLIERTVCDIWGVSRDSVYTKTRKREITEARQIIQHQFKNRLRMNLMTTGMNTGGYDHATVLHSCKVVNNLYQNDKYYRHKFQQVEKRIDGAG